MLISEVLRLVVFIQKAGCSLWTLWESNKIAYLNMWFAFFYKHFYASAIEGDREEGEGLKCNAQCSLWWHCDGNTLQNFLIVRNLLHVVLLHPSYVYLCLTLLLSRNELIKLSSLSLNYLIDDRNILWSLWDENVNFITLQIPAVLQPESKQRLKLRVRCGNLDYCVCGKV